ESSPTPPHVRQEGVSMCLQRAHSPESKLPPPRGVEAYSLAPVALGRENTVAGPMTGVASWGRASAPAVLKVHLQTVELLIQAIEHRGRLEFHLAPAILAHDPQLVHLARGLVAAVL